MKKTQFILFVLAIIMVTPMLLVSCKKESDHQDMDHSEMEHSTNEEHHEEMEMGMEIKMEMVEMRIRELKLNLIFQSLRLKVVTYRPAEYGLNKILLQEMIMLMDIKWVLLVSILARLKG